MKCKEIMTPNPRCCTIFSDVKEAAQIMHEDNVGLVPVVDEETQILVGMVTAQHLFQGLTVGECMSPNPVACLAEDDVQDARILMRKHQIRHIPVIDQDGRCIGLIAQADIERRIAKPWKGRETVYDMLFDFSHSQVVSS